MSDGYEFEDEGCSVLRIEPLTSRTWTIEIHPDGGRRYEAVIMTADDLRALAEAALRIADQ